MNHSIDNFPAIESTQPTTTSERLEVSVADSIGIAEYSRLLVAMYPYAPPAVIGSEVDDTVFIDEITAINNLIDQELGATTEPPMLAFIRRNIESRMLLRYGTNKAAYRVGLYRDSPRPLEGVPAADYQQARRAVESGYATMEQADIVRRSDGMGSMEYGSLTIIGDKRSEHLASMYDEASQLVGVDSADIARIDPYRAEVVGFDREPDGEYTQHMGAVRITLRRHLGYLTDGAELKQRSVVVVDLRPRTGISSDVYAAIFAAYEREKLSQKQIKLARKALKEELGRSSDEAVARSIRLKRLASIPEPVEVDYAKVPEVQAIIEWLVAQDMNHPVVLARNETIYASHPEIDAQIRTQQAERGNGYVLFNRT